MLEFLLIIILIILYFNYLWKRRYLYLYSSKVPGPLALPLIGSAQKAIGKTPTAIFKYLLELIEQYPQLGKVWFGTSLFYLVSKPEYFETILNNQGAYERVELFKRTRVLVGNGLLTAPIPIWKKHRKIIAPSFNTKNLLKFQTSYVKNSKILIETLENLPKNVTFDIFSLTTNCMLDIISECLCGVPIHAQINNAPYGALFNEWIEIYYLRFFKIWYHTDLIFQFTKHGKKHQKCLEEIRALAKTIIEEKRKEIENQLGQAKVNNGVENEWKPLLEHLLDFKKHDFSYEDIENEILTFMLAGTETTATSLCFTMLLLGMHQEIQEKLYNEIGNVLDHGNKDIANVELIDRVIKESLRLFPPLAFAGRELTQDISLGNKENVILPKYSQVFLGYFHVHRNAKYWPDPLKFDPDRFLPEEIAKRHPYTWLPFSIGSRGCIGSKMVIMLMRTVLGIIVRRFKIKTDYKNIEEVELQTSITIKPKDGYKISLSPR